MKIIISVPTGFHARELLIPLKPFFDADPSIERVICLTPAAPYREQIFPDYGAKYEFIENRARAEDYEALFQELRPSLVITTTTGLDPNDVPILRASRTAKIPALTFVASWDNIWKMERLKRQQKLQVIADHLIVWNQIMAKHIRRIFPEHPDNQISIIGAPRLDYFFHTTQIPGQDQLFQYLGIPNDGGKLVHISTTELYPLEYVAAVIDRAVKSHRIKEKIHLYASVHPGGKMQRHEPLKQYGVTVRYSFGRRENAPIKDFLYNPTLHEIYMLVSLFKHSSLLVNHSSTTAIESLLADVPIINVKYGQPFDWWNWYRSMVYRDFQQHYRDIVADGATTVVKNSHQLIEAINASLNHPEKNQAARQRTLQKMITTTDGTASQKVFSLIKKLAR